MTWDLFFGASVGGFSHCMMQCLAAAAVAAVRPADEHFAMGFDGTPVV